jgi:hypothetical protein
VLQYNQEVRETASKIASPATRARRNKMKQITWTGKAGNEITLKASCSITMQNKTADLDGDIITIGKKETVDAQLELWVDGKKIKECTDINFWEIVDNKETGLKKIWGLPVAMEEGQAKEVEAFLFSVIENGKTEDARAFEEKEAVAKKEEDIAEAKLIIEKSKKTYKNSDGTLMTMDEAKKWMKRYNDLHNEGGDGYIPEIITEEQVQYAMSILDK